MPMTLAEAEKMKRETLARIQEEVARLERQLANAKYMESNAQEDLDAASAVAAAEHGVP